MLKRILVALPILVLLAAPSFGHAAKWGNKKNAPGLKKGKLKSRPAKGDTAGRLTFRAANERARFNRIPKRLGQLGKSAEAKTVANYIAAIGPKRERAVILKSLGQDQVVYLDGLGRIGTGTRHASARGGFFLEKPRFGTYLSVEKMQEANITYQSIASAVSRIEKGLRGGEPPEVLSVHVFE